MTIHSIKTYYILVSDMMHKELNMKSLEQVKAHLRPGQVYRRSYFAELSKSPDRHLAQLMAEGTLTKIRQGLYLCPKRTRFGELPTKPAKLVKTFLKDDNFLLTSPNDYNTLGLGTTQLYNVQVVYNHKRHGRFVLDGKTFDFRLKPRFPKKVTPEFLLVDLVNNLNELAEDRELVLRRVWGKIPQLNLKRLCSAVKRFGKVSTQKNFKEALKDVCQ